MTNGETSTTDAQTSALVLKDQAGDYFILPQGLLERLRVPADRRTELEELIAAEDVQGYNALVGGLIGLGLQITWDWLTSKPSMPAQKWWDTYGPGS